MLNSQARKATMKPKEFPAVSKLVLPVIYPAAKRSSSTDSINKSKKSTQEERIAEMVKMTVNMNQAQR